LFGACILYLGYWNLFEICILVLGIWIGIEGDFVLSLRAKRGNLSPCPEIASSPEAPRKDGRDQKGIITSMLPYNKNLKEPPRQLRKNMTDYELPL